MERRNLLAIAAVAVGCLVLAYAFFWPESDEEQIASQLDRLAAAVSFTEPPGNVMFFGSHLADEFEEIFDETVHVKAVEAGASLPEQRQEFAFACAKVLSRFGSLDVTFSDVRIDVGQTARAVASAVATADVSGELRRDTRPVQFELARVDGDWKVTSAIIHPPENQ